LIRNRFRPVFLLVAAYALMTLGAPLVGAGIRCAGRAPATTATATPAVPATRAMSMPGCHEAAAALQADAAPTAQARADHRGDCCQPSFDHHCGCTLAVGVALPAPPCALSREATPVFAAAWTSTACLAEPTSRLLRPPIR